MEILRRFPPLKERLNHRLIVAEALEKLNLRSESLNEYVGLSSLEGITNEQEAMLRGRIAKLRRQAEQ
jgi:hypothetical protein